MGEYIGASIQFGGKLKAEHVDELIDLLNDKGLTVDFDESTGPDRTNLGENFGDWQINYGNLDELQAFGREHGLHYRYWFDDGPEWTEATERYFPDTGEQLEIVGDDSIRLSQVKELGSYAAIINHFEKVKADLPTLEIIP